ncbi:type II secretion system inner membrane protein GspF [Methylophilus sp. 3sh_L]|uniref:type II secretion system inner membrane protein GspF n=1 Tax=Methylophilus sp. 3sh_L TaxID=3377114 RepID=UPI00398EC408
MSAFYYRAIDSKNNESTGVLEAENSKAARALLRDRGLFPIEVFSINYANSGKVSKSRKIKETELALLTRQLATLLTSGLTIEQSLAALIEQAENETSRQLLAGVRSEILSGYSFRAALDRYPSAFSTLYRASVAAGEKSGKLASIMSELADYLERSHSLRSSTLQALLYPMIVACVALMVIIGLMTYVVPQVVTVFQQGKQALPPLTTALIFVSDFLRSWGWLLLLIIITAVFALRTALQDQNLKRRWDDWLLTLPVIGRHLRTLDVTRFASTISILSSSGVPLLSALDAGAQVISRIPLAEAVTAASLKVREGQPLSKALGGSRQFPPLLIHMIANGEATGRTDELLAKVAQLQQAELESKTSTLTTLLEPVLLLVMGGFVMLIVIAVMQPIIEINTLMK